MRKEEILVAAEQLFQHCGFTKTTVAEIAKEAGIGVGTVYLEFPSKDSISSTLCQVHREKVLQRITAILHSDGNYSERLVQILEARIHGLQGAAGHGLHGGDVVFASCRATQRVNDRFNAKETRLLQGFLEEGNAAGAFAVADVPTTARILLKIYDCICSPSEMGATRPLAARNEILPTLHALVLGGVLSRGL